MPINLRNVKIWVFITLCSFFAYNLRLTSNSIPIIRATLLGARDPFFYRFVGGIGVIIHFLGVSLALVSIYLVWKNKEKPFPKVKSLVSVALIFEGLYFLSFLPSIPRLFYFGNYVFLAFSYSLQILFTFPFLTILSLKVRGSDDVFGNIGLIKWIGVASMGYITALWVNNVLRWFDMLWTYGIDFVLSGDTYLGFINGIITLSLALVFAFVGFSSLLRNGKVNTKWWGLSLILVGLHFLIYLLYSVYVDAVSFAFLNELWAIPLLGLGVAILMLKE